MDNAGFIKRDEFVEFAKKSSSVKDFNLRGSRSSTPVGRKDIDKAEVVFRVREGSFRLMNLYMWTIFHFSRLTRIILAQ